MGRIKNRRRVKVGKYVRKHHQEVRGIEKAGLAPDRLGYYI